MEGGIPGRCIGGGLVHLSMCKPKSCPKKIAPADFFPFNFSI